MGALQILSQWWYWDVNNPSDSQDVVQRVMECLVITGNDYEDCMALDCNDIIDCINNTPELQQLIASTALGSSIGSNTPINQTIANSNVVTQNTSCDEDNFFGATTGIVDLYNNLALDLIEVLSASANTAGRLGDSIEAIPGIGELPVDDVLQFTESFLDDIEQNYQASYTVALRDEYRCDLFCIGRNDCELTFTDIFNYFNDRLVTSIILIDFQDLVEYMSNGFFSGEELVHAFHAFVAGTFMLGGDILGIDSAKLITMVSALYNDPDSDWLTLCTDCEWTQHWLNGDGKGLWVAEPAQGNTFATYDSINDQWIGAYNLDTTNRIIIDIPFASTEIKSISFDIDIRNENDTNPRPQQIFIDDAEVFISPNLADGLHTVEWTGTQTCTSITLYGRADQQTGGLGECAIKSITVTGTGANPF